MVRKSRTCFEVFQDQHTGKVPHARVVQRVQVSQVHGTDKTDEIPHVQAVENICGDPRYLVGPQYPHCRRFQSVRLERRRPPQTLVLHRASCIKSNIKCLEHIVWTKCTSNRPSQHTHRLSNIHHQQNALRTASTQNITLTVLDVLR